MAEVQGRGRWVMFVAIAVGVAVLLVVVAYLMTRPGQRPSFVNAAALRPAAAAGAPQVVR